MKKQQRNEHDQRVKAAILEAETLIGVAGRYELTVVLDWGFDGDSEIDENGVTSVTQTTAVTTASWQYAKAKFRYYMPVVAGISDDRLFAVAVHEWVHVLLNPLDSFVVMAGDDPRANDFSKANEYTTEIITRAILAAAGRPYPGIAAWLDEV